jgi:hypothetical protein
VVFVDEAAEEVAAMGGLGRRCRDAMLRIGRFEFESAVWPLRVVVGEVDAEGVFEVAVADDEEPIEAFVSDGADESFRVGVGERRRLRSIPLLSSDLSG